MAEIPYAQALERSLHELSSYPYHLPRELESLASRPVRALKDEHFAELLRRRCFVEVSVRLVARRIAAVPARPVHEADDEAHRHHATLLREIVLLDEQAWQLDPTALRLFQAYLEDKWWRLALPRFVGAHFAALVPEPLRWTDRDFEMYEMNKAYGGLSGGTAAQESVRRLKVAVNHGVPIEYAARGRALTLTTEAQLVEHVVRELAGERDPDDDDDFDQRLYSILERERKIV